MVLPRAWGGTTPWGADVKITSAPTTALAAVPGQRPWYYRSLGAVLPWALAVLPRQRPVLPHAPFQQHDILHRQGKTEDAPKSQRKGGAKMSRRVRDDSTQTFPKRTPS